MTSLELKILKLAQGWAQTPIPEGNEYKHVEHWLSKTGAAMQTREIAKEILSLFPASLKG